ncbi:mitochondrial genome maintenance exonuclease 1 [Biomphalaria pfeifferi]|uniref:Mitochondrial genome maintenance exonuclease 1 n=1 Tax=Biomphalaria pfeifferi TaxID=112525 RepID=A0AAD8FDG4_BIOPF|nr:mitochondrial genome maintenance exonuclease 1 [Biomphalaria pfeifferi]
MYAFNLNDLIQWKKETHLAFGAERKMTKTGKMMKSKKSGLLNERLSVLSDCSSPNAIIIPSKEELDLKVPPQIDSSDFPTPESAYNVDSPAPQLMPTFQDDGNQHAKHVLDGHKWMAHTNMPISLNSKVQSSATNQPLSPLPVSASTALRQNDHEIKCEDEVTQSLAKVISDRKKQSQLLGLTKPDLAVNNKFSLTKNRLKYNNQDKSFFTNKASNAEEDLSEIFIPKLAPIPQPKSSISNISEVYAIKPEPSVLDATSSLPIEPPDSYNVISEVPLFPRESTTWSQSAKLDQLQAFHNDIKALGFRTVPSVKSILNKSMPSINRYFLERWREKMIKELGEEGFQQHQEATIKRGLNLHANIQDYLSGKPLSEIQIMPDNQGHWASLQSTFKTMSNITALEVGVFHPLLLYRGVFDCVAKYKDFLCVIDWKVSKKPRPTIKDTYDDPLQIVAYIGAINANDEYVRKFGLINHGMIVIAYPDGQPSHVHIMDKATNKDYWRTWTDRLYDFYQLTYTEKFGQKIDKATNNELSQKSAS